MKRTFNICILMNLLKKYKKAAWSRNNKAQGGSFIIKKLKKCEIYLKDI